MMDYDKLIEQLNAWNEQHLSVVCGGKHFACDYLCENEDCIVVRAATALSALRPVSREQVEKVWRGEWEDMRESYNDVPKRRCSRCKSVFIGLDTPFCEVCGAPMTDEAVDMVMERMEALYEKT